MEVINAGHIIPFKQVIVCNMAVPFPIGRMFAQCAHASVMAVTDQGRWENGTLEIQTDPSTEDWIRGNFTKVVVKAWGCEKLRDIYDRARYEKIPCSLMEEEGYVTAVALGPASSKTLHPLTHQLALM
jgi:peptidyl-tRNA hydrolase